MSSGANTFNPSDADRLEELTADLTLKEWDEVWNIYAQRGYDAAQRAAQSFTSAFKARYKVTGGDAPPEALAALTGAYERIGDWQPITAALAALGAPVKARTLTDSGDQSVMPSASKAYSASEDPYARMLGADQVK